MVYKGRGDKAPRILALEANEGQPPAPADSSIY